ncbi:MAG TPA: tetratricopeptide repeat protein [Oculatellaceae cyanobacterium]
MRKPRLERFGFALIVTFALVLNLLLGAITLPCSAETVHKTQRVELQLEHAKEDVQQKHYSHAYTRFCHIAKTGHSAAQHISGIMCEQGIGTKRNLKKAVAYYQKAAAQDFAESQSKLGHMYLVGNEVVRKDFDKAKMWLEKAANNNVPEAQHTLGMMYANGQGVQQDLAQASRWLKSAAANGVKEAEEALAKLPPLPMPNTSVGGNPLGSPGSSYAQGLSTVQQSWSGYKDVIQTLNNAHN